MSIKQPRRPGTPGRRRPYVAGANRRPAAIADHTAGPVADAPIAAKSIADEPPVEETATAPAEAPADPAPKLPAPRATGHRGRLGDLLHPPKRTLRWLLPLATLTVAAVTFGAVATVHRSHVDGAEADQRTAADAASSAASTAAQRILGYSYTSVAADLAAAEKQMTPAFAKKFAGVVPTVTSLADQRKLVVTAKVRNAAVLECGEDCSPTTVRVLLFVDQDRTAAGKAIDPIAVRTVFTMTKRDGRWLVSDSVSL